MRKWEDAEITISFNDPHYTKVQRMKVRGRIYGPLGIHWHGPVVNITHLETGYLLASSGSEESAVRAVELICLEASDGLDFTHPTNMSKNKKIKIKRALILAAAEELIFVKGSSVKGALLDLAQSLSEQLEFIDKKKSH